MKLMHPGSYAIRVWTVTLGLSAPAIGGSAAMKYPIRGPDYVVERVAALPQVTVRAITQTRDGYLWIGTYIQEIMKADKYESPHPDRSRPV